MSADEPVFVAGRCILCGRPPESCPADPARCLVVGILRELRKPEVAS